MSNQSYPVIFGEVLHDCFPDGSRILGGAPFNVAWHCQAFGLQPLLISRIGEDQLGNEVLAAMNDWGMKTEGLQIDSIHATGKVNVSFNNNEPSYEIVENSAWDFISSQEIPELNKESILYHGSLALRSPVAAQCLESIKQSTLKSIFIDINLRSPWWNKSLIKNIMQNSQWLKINSDELNLIVLDVQNQDVLNQDVLNYNEQNQDVQNQDNQSIESKARFLLSNLQLELIIVTLGASGAIAISKNEICMVEPENTVNVIDTVGAGDAFTSVLLLGLYNTWPLQETLNRAQQFASKVVGIRGATTQDKNFYQPFIQNWSL